MFKSILLLVATFTFFTLPAMAGDVGQKDDASCTSVSDTVTPQTPEEKAAALKKAEDAKTAAEAK